MQSYPAGLPASSAGKLFFHIQKAAETKGMTVSAQSNPQGPRIHVKAPADGWVYYFVNNNEIWMAVDPQGGDTEAVEARKSRLKTLGDELLADAKARRKEAGD